MFNPAPKPTSTKKKKKKGKNPRQLVIYQLDDVIRNLLKLYYVNDCVCCFKRMDWYHPQLNTFGLQAGHFIGRKDLSLRWALINLHPQCAVCNSRHNKDISSYANYMLNTYGDDIIMTISQMAKTNKSKINRIPIYILWDLLAELKQLETVLRELKLAGKYKEMNDLFLSAKLDGIGVIR